MAKAGKKAPFGGYQISFKGCLDTLEAVMGDKPLAPSALPKKLWGYVKTKKLASKS